MHFLRNAAYYRAWNAATVARRREQFWITLNGNFIDTCMLEWCKLFGDLNAKHHWAKCVSNQPAFLNGLCVELRITPEQFEAFRLEVRAYRDKFVAHLDNLNTMQIPRLQPAIESVEFLYQHLLNVEDDVGAFLDAPRSASAQYQQHLREGRAAHKA
jgi:hypothetical protein